jgi:hypothetical protein
MNWLIQLLTSPLRGWANLLRLLRDPHARLVAGWFFVVLAIILGLGYMYVVNTGFGFMGRGCAAGFSQWRIAALLMLTPIGVALTFSSVGEAIRWMEARRRGRGYKLDFFWKMTGLGGVLLLTAFLLGRC